LAADLHSKEGSDLKNNNFIETDLEDNRCIKIVPYYLVLSGMPVY